MFGREMQRDELPGDVGLGDGVLGSGRGFVFDFEILVVGQKLRGTPQHIGHLARRDAVVFVGADPRLKLAGLGVAHRAAAVNEFLLHVRHFGDVERDRHGIEVGQNQAESFVAVVLQ